MTTISPTSPPHPYPPKMNEQDTDVMVRATKLCVQGLGDSEGRGNMKNHLVSTCLAPACASWPWSTFVASSHTLLWWVTELLLHRPPWAGQACSRRTLLLAVDPPLEPLLGEKGYTCIPCTSPFFQKISAAPPGSALCSRARRSTSGTCCRVSLADDGVQ